MTAAEDTTSGETTPEEVPTPETAHGDDCACHSHHGYIEEKQRYLARLKRIEGQTRGIHRMIDEEQYCIDILTQISAVNSALKNVAFGLLDDHLKHCVHDAAVLGGDDLDAKLKEVSDAIARFSRT